MLGVGFAPNQGVTITMWHMFRVALVLALLAICVTSSVVAEPPVQGAQRALIVVVGAPGEESFGEQFQSAATAWQELAEQQQWPVSVIGADVDKSLEDYERLQQTITEAADAAERELLVVLIGHGTFGNNTSKFNLVGRDVSAVELNNWLKPIRGRTVVINCSSCSGPFLTALAGTNRVIVTATRSGVEQNYSRFGKYFAESLKDLTADVDHDREISLLEVFLVASSKTERFYREDARLATEHALLDDNGDRVGTSSDFYRGVRPAKEAESGKKLDGRVAAQTILFSAPDAVQLTVEQQAERSRIENQLETLRSQKSQLEEQIYLDQLEQLALTQAKLYEQAQ